MSESRIILRLKVGGHELHLEGSRQALMEMLREDLPQILEVVSTALAKKLEPPTPSAAPEDLPAASPASPAPYAVGDTSGAPPAVTAKSCSEAILALLNSEWGRLKPRTISEMKAALDGSALHYSGKVIGFTLTRLTRRQRLRRWKAKEGYVYTTAA